MVLTDERPAAGSRRSKRKQFERLLIFGVPSLLLLPIVFVVMQPAVARARYRPQDGDIVFQSLHRSKLVNAIEGATHSPFSHCGVIGREDGRWYVYEAFNGVSRTPLNTWLARGRNGGFAVYRLEPGKHAHIPAMLAAAKRHLGKRYDTRYQLGDEALYCSELVYLAYQDATGEPLGQLVRLKDLDWQPYRELIEQIEQGPVPLEREIITPRHLAAAPQLEPVYRFGL